MHIVQQEREERYGRFDENARIAQGMKKIIRTSARWDLGLLPHHKEALDQICSKISRIVTGDPLYPDNWLDIELYANRSAAMDEEK